MFIDARIPVRFCETMPRAALADAALIVAEGHAPPPVAGWAALCVLTDGVAAAHPADCRCCGSRSLQAVALTRLFQQRARGETSYFRLLIACLPSAQADALRMALTTDIFLSSCFKQQH